MTPDQIAADIRKRTEEHATEFVRRKRLNPNIYEVVVKTLAHMEPKPPPDESPETSTTESK